ncbi:hypothetical protein C8Q77DRAFT_1236530 [Trametes polyzona]|nr:hypothetical protein C8Q77DRAFT_1236530 [Trametes polyzona]
MSDLADELHGGWGSLFADVEDDDDLDYDPFSTEYDSDRLSDASEWDPVPLEDAPAPPIQLQDTRAKRRQLGSASKLERVHNILKCMEDNGMNIPMFLDTLSWGDDECIHDPKVRYERTALMVSEELPYILRRWYRTPRASTSRAHYVRPAGARKALEEFAMECAAEVLDRELETTAHLFRSPEDSLSEASLTSFDFAEVASGLQNAVSGAPRTWTLLHGAMCRAHRSPSDLRSKTRKNPTYATVMLFSQLQYMRSRNATAWIKPLTVFLKAKGTSAKSLDLLHALGITMSHSWSVRAYTGLSEKSMEELQSVIHHLAWWLAYDNVNFAFRVFSQRLKNQSHFDSGTSGSVFVKPNAPPPPPLSSAALQEQRRLGQENPITLRDIVALEVAAAPRIRDHLVHIVLRILLDCPEFDLSSYTGRDHTVLASPPAVSRLPYGPDHVTRQYVLGTVHIDEASYDGTKDLIKEWMHQLKLDSPDEQKRTGLERVLVWIGDQLTVDRLRMLANYRCEDLNGYGRLDWLVVVFGWFHALMAFANSLHRQYFGSASGHGLRQAFAHLSRKGLQTVQIKGTFYHHLHEGITHVSEARFRDCWRKVGGVEKLADLRTRSPEELCELAKKLVRHYASNDAVEDMDALADGQHDDVLCQSIMWNRDVLYYLLLHRSMQSGDVGMMEDLLPHLLYRFAGGGNHKYTVEILELLQGLHREWPQDLKDFVRQNCWLVNLTGGPEDFQAIDLVEEHTVKDVKVTYRPKGPNSTWKLMKARAPAIPTLRALDRHVTDQFHTVYRGVSHTAPSKEADIQHLDEFYQNAKIHEYQAGRDAEDSVKEVVNDGYLTVNTNIREKWVARRSNFPRSATQIWPEDLVSAPPVLNTAGNTTTPMPGASPLPHRQPSTASTSGP